jgi:hypothetical protein
MGRALVEVLVGGAVVGALWLWLQYVAWGGVRYQRRAAWLPSSLARRVKREARRKQRKLDREIRRFLRRTASRPARSADQPDQAEQQQAGSTRRTDDTR